MVNIAVRYLGEATGGRRGLWVSQGKCFWKDNDGEAWVVPDALERPERTLENKDYLSRTTNNLVEPGFYSW